MRFQGFFDADGARHYPASALVCSYPESTPRKPSLLQHRDVRIMFHELGHAIHSLVERTKYATGQSRDFGEIPSKMLEHFIWLPEVMIRLSRHYTTLPEFIQEGKVEDEKGMVGSISLPLDLARAVERTKTVNFASGLLNFLKGALFDLALYTPKTHEEAIDMDTTALWNRLGRQYLPVKLPDDEDTFGQASFSPCFRGNEVGFFTYLM